MGADVQGPLAGGLEALGPMGRAEAQDTGAIDEAMLAKASSKTWAMGRTIAAVAKRQRR